MGGYLIFFSNALVSEHTDKCLDETSAEGDSAEILAP